MNDWLQCAECKEPLQSDPAENDPASPCPKCGSAKRDSNVAVGTAVFGFKAYAPSVIVAPALSSILLQAVVERGLFVPDGQLITAVAPAWMTIIGMIEEDPDFLFKVDPRKFEEIIAGAYKAAGFDEVILTPRSGDLGRDVIAIKKGYWSVRIIDQVKRYGPDHRVTADEVRALIGVLHMDCQASKGIVTTTSDFAPMVATDRLIAPLIPNRLELVNGTDLITRLKDVASGFKY